MPTLSERLDEVMTAMKWTRADVMRITGQSSSVVSQWMGRGAKNKIIRTIGSVKAAIMLERASGYSGLWIAEGEGLKMAPRQGDDASLHVRQITAWAKQLEPGALLDLHAFAHGLTFDDASAPQPGEAGSPTPAPKPAAKRRGPSSP